MSSTKTPVGHSSNTSNAGNPQKAVVVKKKEKVILLSDQEKQQFGNRCPDGFKKLSVLGKGGIALVWLGLCSKTGLEVAMKQFPKVGGKCDSSAGVEI